MFRTILLIAWLALMACGDAAPSGGDGGSSSSSRTCCKYCRSGKACGDSCISTSSTCHSPPGCACNG